MSPFSGLDTNHNGNTSLVQNSTLPLFEEGVYNHFQLIPKEDELLLHHNWMSSHVLLAKCKKFPTFLNSSIEMSSLMSLHVRHHCMKDILSCNTHHLRFPWEVFLACPPLESHSSLTLSTVESPYIYGIHPYIDHAFCNGATC